MEGRTITLNDKESINGTRDNKVNIRRFERADLPAVLSIQSRTTEISQWSLADYEGAVDGEMLAYVATGSTANESDDVLGFLIARRVADDMEILNFAVTPEFRRQSVGAALLEYALHSPELAGVQCIFLEVRASNHPAIRFYRSHDFEITGTRRNYYRSPVEDALLLRRSILLKK